MSEPTAVALPHSARPRLHPERPPEREGPLDAWLQGIEAALLVPLAPQRARALARVVGPAARLEPELRGLDDAALRARGAAVGRLMRPEALPHARSIGEMFAVVREAARRVLELRLHDVQLVGGHALLRGMVAEMQTGEGKTLTAALPAIAAALSGTPVHVVSVNDYLVARDAEALAPLYAFFGLRVGRILHGLSPAERRAAYACDVTYCTNKDLAFDYLRDRLVLLRHRSELRYKLAGLARPADAGGTVMRGLHFAIVDEADSVLVDEARTPLILSRDVHSEEDTAAYVRAVEIAGRLDAGTHYRLDAAERRVELTAAGGALVADLGQGHGGRWTSRLGREDLVTQALTALHLMQRGDQYIVRDGKVQIVDEYNGRILPDRFWSDGLHQMVEIKEGCELSGRRVSMARITFQRFFRRYQHLAGMTGTAREIAGELWRVYRLPLAPIPTHRPSRRRVEPDRIFATAEQKWAAITAACGELHARGVPVLLGTRSVAASLEASARLGAAGIPHVVLNAAQDAEEAAIVARAGAPGQVTVATNMAGRGTDIRLGAGVAERGGLHVIMSERHDSGRIDRQLAGRCARQGEPGWFAAFMSLEDPLVAMHGGALARRLAGAARPLLGTWPARLVVTAAQRSAERRHARIRRDLLRQDDSLDQALAFSGPPE